MFKTSPVMSRQWTPVDFALTLLLLLDKPSLHPADQSVTLETIHYNLTELLPAGTFVGDVRAYSGLALSSTPSDLSRMRFDVQSTIGQTGNGSFEIDRTVGIIRTGKLISRNAICPYLEACDTTLYIRVTPIDLLRFFKVVISIVDINDATPAFPQPARSLNVSRQLSLGSTISLPAADDRDSPANGIRLYKTSPDPVTSAGSSQPFDVRALPLSDGSIAVTLVLVASLRDGGSAYHLSVLAVDGGSPPATGTLLVDVTVTATQDNGGSTTSSGLGFSNNGVFIANVTENSPVGTIVTRVSVTSESITATPGGRIFYSFDLSTTSACSKIFGIDNKTGDVTLIGNIDREQLAGQLGSSTSAATVCALFITAVDLTRPSLSPAYARLSITVLDVNDNSPSVYVTVLTGTGSNGGSGSSDEIGVQLAENSPVSSAVVYVSVDDPDFGSNGAVICRSDSGLFKLQSAVSASGSGGAASSPKSTSDYILSTTVTFDRGHQVSPYSVVVTCSDGGSPPRSATRKIGVSIFDAGPSFSSDQVLVNFPDRNTVGHVITTVQSNTTDTGLAATPGYRIDPIDWTSSSAPEVSIAFRSGVVVASVTFRYDTTSSSSRDHRYLVTATDDGIVPMSATMTLTVRVVNSLPYFERPAYAFAVAENQPAGTSVGRVAASVDSPSSGCRFSVGSDGSSSSQFLIDPTTGVITTSGPVIRSSAADADQRHTILLGATNYDRPQATSYVNATIFVVSGGVDVSGTGSSVYFQYPPAGGDNVVRATTDVPNGSFVVQLKAVSRSLTSSGRLTYSFVGGNEKALFALESQTGVIRTAVGGDHLGDPGTVYTLAIAASLDNGGGSAVAVLVVVIAPRTATVASATTAAPGTRSDSSSESTWWIDNGKTVIAISASVSAAVVLAVVVIVVCIVCRLSKASKDFEKSQAATAPSVIGSDGLPRTLPSSRASTPFYLDDLCSCSRRSSRRGGSSRADDSFDAGFSVRLDGSSSSGVYCSRQESSITDNRSGSIVIPPLGVETRLRRESSGQRQDSPQRKYDSDSGVESSYRRQFTPSPSRGSQYGGSVSGGGGITQRKVDRHHRTHSSTSPTGSSGTTRSSRNGSVRKDTILQTLAPQKNGLEDFATTCLGSDVTRIPVTDFKLHHQPVIMAGHCTVTVGGPATVVGSGHRRQKSRRSATFRKAASSSSSASESDRRGRVSQPPRPASSSPPRQVILQGRGSASVGASPSRHEEVDATSDGYFPPSRLQRYAETGLPPRSPLYKFAQPFPPLLTHDTAASGFVTATPNQQAPEVNCSLLPQTVAGCQRLVTASFEGGRPPIRGAYKQDAAVANRVSTGGSGNEHAVINIDPRDYQIPTPVVDYEPEMQIRRKDNEIQLKNRPSRSSDDYGAVLQPRQHESLTSLGRDEGQRYAGRLSSQRHQQWERSSVGRRAMPDSSYNHRQMSPAKEVGAAPEQQLHRGSTSGSFEVRQQRASSSSPERTLQHIQPYNVRSPPATITTGAPRDDWNQPRLTDMAAGCCRVAERQQRHQLPFHHHPQRQQQPPHEAARSMNFPDAYCPPGVRPSDMRHYYRSSSSPADVEVGRPRMTDTFV